MKVFANREIRKLFQAVLAVWAVALALTQGVALHTTHAFSFGSLFVFLLLGGLDGLLHGLQTLTRTPPRWPDGDTQPFPVPSRSQPGCSRRR